MPLPRVEYKLDKYHNGQFAVMKVVDGTPEGEVGKYWELDDAKREVLELNIKHLVHTLFPFEDLGGDDSPEAVAKQKQINSLTELSRKYFSDLLRVLPLNDDAQYARKLARQAHMFARSAILLDGMV